MPAFRLSELAENSGVRFFADFGSDPHVEWITDDTRKMQPKSLFVCMPSKTRDSHELLSDASSSGAVACVVHDVSAIEKAKSLGLAVIGFVNEGQAFCYSVGNLCRVFFEDPSSKMTLVGVTGTNGKTTVAWMIRNSLEALNVKAAYLGTLGFQTDSEMEVIENTTPFPVELWQLLYKAKERGCEAVILEASSHALFQRRLAGVSFDVGVFTNLTQDHLDFHGNMDSYEAAKLLLFTEYAAASSKEFAGCLNIDSPTTEKWLPQLPCPAFTFGSTTGMIQSRARNVSVGQIEFSVNESSHVNLKFGGNYNVENATAAVTTLVALGYTEQESLTALATVNPVPGRFEAIPNDNGIGVLVDYAHTPDALVNLLESVRKLSPNRIITVFGCGGDRDNTKRPKMALAASSLSDITIVTSDNPRTEDPQAIINEVLVGIDPLAKYESITDRNAAISRAIELAESGDVVVIAGKGHEDYQIIGREKFHMSDQEMCREALEKKGGVLI